LFVSEETAQCTAEFSVTAETATFDDLRHLGHSTHIENQNLKIIFDVRCCECPHRLLDSNC
jgi:hypothetical protein